MFTVCLSVSICAADMEKDPKVLAAAAKEFEKFYESEIFSEIVNSFASVCELLDVQPGSFISFYSELKVLSQT